MPFLGLRMGIIIRGCEYALFPKPLFFIQANSHHLRLKVINFMCGKMGLANAQRTLNYISVLTEFITQPEYQDLIPIFGIVNEPTAGTTALSNFYLEAHTLIRNIMGLGAGHGPVSSFSTAIKERASAD